MKIVKGFSKMSKMQKIDWLKTVVDPSSTHLIDRLSSYWLNDSDEQKKFDDFSENTLTNFNLPFGIAPNFLINQKIYTVPMVIEESSVVAAASLGAKFWLERGGFQSKILGTQKVGHVHFIYTGQPETLRLAFDQIKPYLLEAIEPLVVNMKKRGGGIKDLRLIDQTHKLDHYFQLEVTAQTCDAMGANFINSVLEEIARVFKNLLSHLESFRHEVDKITIMMSILSNFTPQCLVESSVECKVSDLGTFADGMSAETFAFKFKTALEIARVDVSRAVTHNKGIMNGMDAVVLATGNDFRAIEACAHAYAAKDGQYRSLSTVELTSSTFRFSIKVPLALGTVGGLTSLHPLVKTSMSILHYPSAEELMKIVSCVGLAQNFSAVRSLVTTGIQKGHMKLHLLNILNQMEATPEQVEDAKKYFSDKIVSYKSVRDFMSGYR